MVVIYIQNTIGKTFRIQVELEDTMKRVKEKIFDREGYPVDQQTLTIDGKEVKDDVQFTHYYMHAEMHFQLVVKEQESRLQEFRRMPQRKQKIEKEKEMHEQLKTQKGSILVEPVIKTDKRQQNQ